MFYPDSGAELPDSGSDDPGPSSTAEQEVEAEQEREEQGDEQQQAPDEVELLGAQQDPEQNEDDVVEAEVLLPGQEPELEEEL